MSDLDFSAVDPMFRDEARRRIEVFDRYLAIERPTTADAESFGKEIGVGKQQFYWLIKLWRMHRDPTVVGVGERGFARRRRDGVSQDVRDVVSAVFAEYGAEAPLEDLLREVHRRCERLGKARPSRGAVWTYQMDARSTAPIRADEPSRIVVGRIWSRLPIAHGDDHLLPEIAIAILLPTRQILGIDVSTSTDRRASAALALARAFPLMQKIDPRLVVAVDAADLQEVAPVHVARTGRHLDAHRGSVSKLLRANLGRTFGGMGIVHQPQKAKSKRLLKARAARPLQPWAAVLEIERAVRAHNDIVRRIEE